MKAVFLGIERKNGIFPLPSLHEVIGTYRTTVQTYFPPTLPYCEACLISEREQEKYHSLKNGNRPAISKHC
jgi:hypothetical protein